MGSTDVMRVGEQAVESPGYRGPIVAAVVLCLGLGLWAWQEWRAVAARHQQEMRRFAEGIFLAIDLVRSDDTPPMTTQPVTADQRLLGHRPSRTPRQHMVGQLEPVLTRVVESSPLVVAAGVLFEHEMIVRAGELDPTFALDTSAGERTVQNRSYYWRPLSPPGGGRNPPPAWSGNARGPGPELGPGMAGPPPRRQAGEVGRGLPAHPPIVIIGLDSTLPHAALRRELVEMTKKVGIGALGVLALCAAWVQSIRSRALAHRLAIESEQRSNLEELSLAASGLAHETKNPLGIIRGLAQRLKGAPQLSEADQDSAAQILEEADRAVHRLGDFISYARVRTPEIGPVAVRPLLEKVVSVLSADSEAAGVRIQHQGPDVTVLADRDMLLQILLNLTLNSVQASSPGGVVTLRLRVNAGKGVLVVEDQGRGVPPELLPTVFKPYVTGREHGHGLGLTIVRRQVVQHGWTIAMRSTSDTGTRVEVSGIVVQRQPRGVS